MVLCHTHILRKRLSSHKNNNVKLFRCQVTVKKECHQRIAEAAANNQSPAAEREAAAKLKTFLHIINEVKTI